MKGDEEQCMGAFYGGWRLRERSLEGHFGNIKEIEKHGGGITIWPNMASEVAKAAAVKAVNGGPTQKPPDSNISLSIVLSSNGESFCNDAISIGQSNILYISRITNHPPSASTNVFQSAWC